MYKTVRRAHLFLLLKISYIYKELSTLIKRTFVFIILNFVKCYSRIYFTFAMIDEYNICFCFGFCRIKVEFSCESINIRHRVDLKHLFQRRSHPLSKTLCNIILFWRLYSIRELSFITLRS